MKAGTQERGTERGTEVMWFYTEMMQEVSGSYKTRNETEPEVIGAQYGRGRRIHDVLMSAHHGTESSSCVLYQPRRRDKHPADSIEPHQAY